MLLDLNFTGNSVGKFDFMCSSFSANVSAKDIELTLWPSVPFPAALPCDYTGFLQSCL